MVDNPFEIKDDLTLNQKEYKLQCHIIKKHQQYFPHVLITHIPNRPANAADGFHKKKMGVRAGVSDIAIWWLPEWLNGNSDVHYGLKPMQAGMIELKVDTKISSAQNKWLSAFSAAGGYISVVHSWEGYYIQLCRWGIKPMSKCEIFEEPNYTTQQEKFSAAFDLYKP